MATRPKGEPLTTQPASVPPEETSAETAPLGTASPRLAAGLTYLQLSATRRQSAERMIEDLRQRNFPAVIAEIDGKPGLFRVFVGPVTATAVLRLRSDLERAGFPGNAAIRRSSAESKLPKSDDAISVSASTAQEGSSSRPVAGQTYLELTTASWDSAQLLVDVLRQKKFNAIVSEIVEKPGMFRVLVGPVEDTSVSIAQMRADLEGAGLSGNAAIPRTLESDSAKDPANPAALKSLPPEAAKADASSRPVSSQTYLEFSAPSPQTAEIIADALHQKGFEAILSETKEPPGDFRVLVRPLSGTSIDQLRADLERAGFHGNAAVLRISK